MCLGDAYDKDKGDVQYKFNNDINRCNECASEVDCVLCFKNNGITKRTK